MAYVRTTDSHTTAAGVKKELADPKSKILTMDQAKQDAEQRNQQAIENNYRVRYEAVDD